MLYVEDAVNAIVKSIEQKRKGVFNIGTGNPIEIGYMIGVIKDRFDELKVEMKPSEECATILLDTSKAEKELEFKANTDFDKGMALYFKELE